MSKSLNSGRSKDSVEEHSGPSSGDSATAIEKSRWECLWPVIACGAGLFSDGYLNGVIGSVNTMLKKVYGAEYTKSIAQNKVSSITFAGTVVGMLLFGYISDHFYSWLRKPDNIAGSVIVYGVFLALGEVGPGDNIGLFASKTSATAVRGQYYGIAAALGKIGAFVGSWIFPVIQANAPGGADSIRGGQDPFFVGSALAIFSGIIAMVFLPNIGQDDIEGEDRVFRAYLEKNGFDTTQMGTRELEGTVE